MRIFSTEMRSLMPASDYAGAAGDDFILMDDNVPPHRARVVQQYLEQKSIVHME
jgi:hypothetical protein